jgi:AcrR family transcriptional regulator
MTHPPVPRRVPQQRRAQATVDAILAAAAHILVKGGYPALNTNDVARVAGVSIGSLYQYFPSKAALVDELNRRHATEVATPIFAALNTHKTLTVPAVLRKVIRASIQSHRIQPELHRVLSEQLPNMDEPAWQVALKQQARQLVRAFLQDRRAEMGPRHLGVATFLLMHIVETAVHAAVWLAPAELKSGVLGRELEVLLSAYLNAGRIP